MRIVVIFLLVVISLSGCETLEEPVATDSLAYQARNSSIDLLQTLAPHSKQDKVFFQKGKQVSQSEVNIVDPLCTLEAVDAAKSFRLKKERLSVIGISVNEEEISGGFARATAAIGEMTLYSTQIYLRARHSSAVLRLTCSKMAEPHQNAHMSSSDFKNTVGSNVQLHRR